MDDITIYKIKDLYPRFNNEAIILISMEAWERGHSAGQDEVNNIAIGIAYFVNEVLDAILT